MDTILTYEADPPIPEGMDKALPLYAPILPTYTFAATNSVHVLHVLHVLWKLETRTSPLTILHGLQGQG